jgi:hypothetical protein
VLLADVGQKPFDGPIKDVNGQRLTFREENSTPKLTFLNNKISLGKSK